MKRKLPLLYTLLSALLFSLAFATASFAQSGFSAGIVTDVTDTSMTLEDGTSCTIDSATLVQGDLVVGAIVQAFTKATVDDGCAYSIILVDDEAMNEEVDFASETNSDPSDEAGDSLSDTLEGENDPTVDATATPTADPVVEPTVVPTIVVTEDPVVEPTVAPTIAATPEATEEPVIEPTGIPTVEPTEEPVVEPTEEPTIEPTPEPTVDPTPEPEDEDDDTPTAQFVRKSGLISAADAASITLDGVTCAITADTVIRGDIVVDAKARLLGEVDAEGTCTALIVYVRRTATQDPVEFDHTSSVRKLSETSIKVGRLTFVITDETQISEALEIGDKVYVQATKLGRGSYTATVIELIERPDPDVESDIKTTLSGVASDVTETTLVVGGVTIELNTDTEIIGDLVDGATVSVKAVGPADGTTLVATKVRVYTPSTEEMPTFLRGEASAVTESSVMVGETVVGITADTQITGDLADGAKIFVRAEADADGVLTATSIYVKQEATTFSTDTKSVAGRVQSLTDTDITLRRKTFVLTENSEMPEALAEGDRVRLTAQLVEDGSYEVLLIESLNAIVGTVESISDKGVWVSSVWYRFGEDADIEGNIAVGDLVTISTEIDQSAAPLSPLMRAASAEPDADTALLISPTVLAPTSIGLAASGTVAGVDFVPLLLAGLFSLSLMISGLFAWQKSK